MDDNVKLNERVKGLEVKLFGNGRFGLDDKVDQNECKIKELDEKVDQIRINMVDKNAFESHIKGEYTRLDRWKEDIINHIDMKIKQREKYWVRYLGPILTGVAAILAVLLSNKGGLF